MNSFGKIYQEVYKNAGIELEEAKKSINMKRAILGVIIAVIIISFLLRIPFLPMIAIFVDLILYFMFRSSFMQYRLIFKDKVIRQFVKAYSDKLEYYPNEGIPFRIYNKAGFDGHYDRFRSEDLIKGTILDNCEIAMSEVWTEREEETVDQDGHHRREYVTIFRGLFACIDLKSFLTFSFRITRNVFLSNMFKGKQKLEMDSGEFEKIFDVKTDDKINTLRILTSDIMQMLIDFKNENKITPEIVFQDNKLYIRFAVGNVFEPNKIKGDMDFDKLKENYDMINFIFKLTEEFSKNIVEFEE